jgi:hypothetical protein
MGSIWDYDDAMGKAELDVVGYEAHAADGRIGTVDEASHRAGAAYVVVDTNGWIAGERRVIPAGLVRRVDENDRTLLVSLTQDEIASAPPLAEQDRDAPEERYDAYYGAFAG